MDELAAAFTWSCGDSWASHQRNLESGDGICEPAGAPNLVVHALYSQATKDFQIVVKTEHSSSPVCCLWLHLAQRGRHHAPIDPNSKHVRGEQPIELMGDLEKIERASASPN